MLNQAGHGSSQSTFSPLREPQAMQDRDDGSQSRLSTDRGRGSVWLPTSMLLCSLVVAVAFPRFSQGAVFPPYFDQEEVFTGHLRPTAIRFAPNGNVFVAEKSGMIYAYEDIEDTTKTLVVDLNLKVHAFWDRGLLGLAVDPGYPTVPYIYVLYAFDAFDDGTYPRWGPGETPSDEDPCPNPPGALGDGCVVHGLLSRIQIDPLTLQAIELPISGIIGPDEPLLSSDWCLQFPSHSLGDLVFGEDGYLYVSSGEGASFHSFDWGQEGSPQNPCDDPPDGFQTASVPDPNNSVAAEGGALRSQDILTPSDRTDLSIPGRPDYVDRATFDGSLLRIDVSTLPVQAPADNPLVTLNTVPDDDLIVAMGLRNPFRINKRPGTQEIWITDVGWSTWEEINRVADPGGTVENFGWPCFEGDNSGNSILDGYDQQELCQDLYDDNIPLGIDLEAPYYSYHHNQKVVPDELCPTGTSSATGLTFNTADVYPPVYDNALFFADSSRSCIWTMFADSQGNPDKNNRLALVSLAGGQ
ncbi:MAG: PQQ-dependent sugar dehydrogenase, partial [Acidobacteriota bacterium]